MSSGPDLARLEEIALQAATEWGIELGPAFALSRFSYAAPAGQDAVLKVTPPEDDEADHEADALDTWGGDGAVHLLRHEIGRAHV